jgi:hypothetical protein
VSPEQLNTALVEQYKRLGGNDDAKSKINAALQQFGGTSVMDIPVESRAGLIAYVQGLQ